MANRSGDPSAWSCLNDEQRDIIHKWYIETEKQRSEVTFENSKRSAGEILEKCKSAALDPSVCLIAWVTVARMRGSTFFQIVLTAVLSVALFYGGTYVLYEAGRLSEKSPVERRVFLATISAMISASFHR